MLETRCECSWCHEIVSVRGASRPSAVACTGQPLHSAHVWIQNHAALRNRIPFENQRRFAPKTQVPNRGAMTALLPIA